MFHQRITEIVQELMKPYLPPGGTVLDATMGNGRDTLFLARCVGSRGKVYAFDIQQDALDATARRLEEAECREWCNLVLEGHQHLERHVGEPLDGAMFNLGYLPGAPKEAATRGETTLLALESVLRLLKPGGVCSLVLYPGHPEGALEQQEVLAYLQEKDGKELDALLMSYPIRSGKPPSILVIYKKSA
ncbi:class I SAM-dependent methyltransferase [Anaerotalea alkaliphila]|uniref:Methyltransferase domain-containing protein n=1 Tax=Anaerotalea alkaliphila TaxID=2662126 RepID=A0A7X5HTK3_9FIRM|nr:class I SAM-dependent methyltransferase [Anaerotalea alkaliphila]NDL66295.1 methyltransferase domain-containing protein [Anaerotalea alkaliphila]